MQADSPQSSRDTQPASQWVYDRFTHLNDPSQEVQGDAKASSSNDLKDEDAGPMESVENVDQQDEEEDILSQDIRMEPFPESKRFQMPKTPASQGRKRKRDSPAESQELQTPSLPINIFANRQGGQNFMGPSQLFNVTQAETSPPVVASDGLSDRPSPDLHNVQRPATATSTTPVPLPRSSMVRVVTDPQSNYISMKESQEAREKRQRMLEPELSPDELWDDEFSTMDSDVRRYLDKKDVERIVKTQLAGLTGNSKMQSKQPWRRGRAKEKPKSSTVLRHASNERDTMSEDPSTRPQALSKENPTPNEEVLVISDDAMPEDMQGSITEEETDRENVDQDRSSVNQDDLTEENKENIEVPMTGARDPRATITSIAQSSPSDSHARRSARVTRAAQNRKHSSDASVRRSPERPEHVSLSSQGYAIADSQTSTHVANITRPSNLIKQTSGFLSSSDSRAMVPQSQLSQIAPHPSAPTDSQTRKLDERLTSMTTLPPPLSSDTREPMTGSTDQSLPGLTRPVRNARSVIPPSSSDQSINQGEVDELSTGTRPSGSSNSVLKQQPNSTILKEADQHTSIPSPRSTPKSVVTSASKPSTLDHSNPSTRYETAQEQISGTPSLSRIRRLQQDAQSTESTPTKSPSQRLRSIQEIANQASASNSFLDEDLNIDLLGDDDHQFLNAISRSSSERSTPKNRRFLRKSALQTKASHLSITPMQAGEARGTPNSPPASAFSILTPPDSSLQDELANTPPPKIRVAQNEQQSNVPPPDVNKISAIRSNDDQADGEQTDKITKPVQTDAARPPRLFTHQTSANTNVAANRVFAHFNGRESAFYPATCTAVIPGEDTRYEVLFDDGNSCTVGGYGIKRLELREGDVCKVDIKGKRGKNFIVQNLQRLPPDDLHSASAPSTGKVSTDVLGNTHVALTVKHRLSSTADDSEDVKPQIVPIWRIYFTQTMWGHIKDREFTFKAPGTSGLQTPSERPSTPSAPSSRARRNKTPAVNPVHNAPTNINNTLFSNTAFAITNINLASDLSTTTSQIRNHGGRILDSGFDELFSIPDLARMYSPSSKSDRNTFRLKPSAQALQFTCLIADRHCRRAKYIQALALGIPCVSTRWIHDCIAQNSLLELPPYLLPAGESSYLHGAVKSRVLRPFPDPVTCALQAMIDARQRMLDGAAVLLVVKKDEEMAMSHHHFLLLALGSKRVVRVASAEAAKKNLAEGQEWQYVVCYDREKDVERAIFGGGGGKKRNKGVSIGNDLDAGRKRPMVVGNEWLIQSLILGRLIDK